MRPRGNAVPIKRMREESPCLSNSLAWEFLKVAGQGLRKTFRLEAAFHAGYLAAAGFACSAQSRVPVGFRFEGHSPLFSSIGVPRCLIFPREGSPCRR